ncbi:MAG TPA: D-cysteine desulfhydrase [Steroidobacteraceae bacterium]|nr:D-cysteine desulfhydrase [Steroidobacteraceae bacterium]
MKLFDLPKRTYTEFATPLEPLPRLSKALGGPEIWIKRDDQLGLAGGGNKTRKLEYVMAAALKDGAKAVMTVGAVQSNHCRLTLAAAKREGLACYLVIEERVKGSYSPQASGNNMLFHLLGVKRIFVSPFGADIKAAIAKARETVRNETGIDPYFIPGGASNPLGATGYAAAVLELLGQCARDHLSFDSLVAPSGSGGTHAGLLAGKALFGFPGTILGVSTRHAAAAQKAHIESLARETLTFLESKATIPPDWVTVGDEWVGPGYSIPDERTIEAIRLFADEEGILLDPVYTGKTAAGLIGMIRRGDLTQGKKVLFWHTGGWPALFAYGDKFPVDGKAA